MIGMGTPLPKIDPDGSLPGGWPAHHARIVLESVGSTNDEALAHAACGDAGPIWIAARRQTGGRGRNRRPWSMEEGNLAATLLLPSPVEGPAHAATLCFVAGLAVAAALERLAPLQVQLKWPNDALVGGRKIAGVLLEGTGAGGLAVGMGINLAHAPDVGRIGLPATSVAAETGKRPSFEEALVTLAQEWDVWHRLWESGFETVRQAWMARAAYLGKQVEARLPKQTLEGRFAGIGPNGSMVLEMEKETRMIAAADVFPTATAREVSHAADR